MKRWYIIFACLACMTGWNTFSPAYAEDTLQIHVIHASPIGFNNSQNEPEGYHWDYIAEIEKRSGFSLNRTLTPYARIWRGMAEGWHDGGIVFRSSDRDNIVEYVAAVRDTNNIVISRKGIALKTYDDLYKLESIGSMRDNRLGDRFDDDPEIKKRIVPAGDYDTLIKMIKRGHLDAISGNSMAMAYLLNKFDAVDAVELPGIIIGTRTEWFQMSKKSKHIDKIPGLAKAIRELRAEGVFEKIMEKYVDEKLMKLLR